jgi:predicted nuclease with TOPRIM domain
MDIKKRKEEVQAKMRELVPALDQHAAQMREIEQELHRLAGEMRLLEELSAPEAPKAKK